MKIKNKNPNVVEIESIEYGGCFYYHDTLYIRVKHSTTSVCAIRAYDGEFVDVLFLGNVLVRKVEAELVVESQ